MDFFNSPTVPIIPYGPGIDEPICMIGVANGDKVYYYHFDGLGSVVALSDVNSEIVERYSYGVFGEPNRVSDINNPYLFTGRAYDSETGLYYYRARYYKPSIGRFLQTDPVGYTSGLNLYTYCGNNPLNWSDPYGLCKSDSLWDQWSNFVRSSDLLTSIGAFTIGALERIYDIELALCHPGKSLGEWTVNSLENIYDFEAASYDILYDLGRRGESSEWYKTWYNIGRNPQSLVSDVGRAVAQSDLLSADPYTAGHAWGSLTVNLEITAVVTEAISSVAKSSLVFETGGTGAETTHIGVDLAGGRNIIHYGKHVAYGKHIGIWYKRPYVARWHINLP